MSAAPLFGLRRATRLLVLGLIAIAAMAAWHWRVVFDPIAITTAIGRYPAAPLGFIAAHIAASLVFIPRTLLAIVAGLLFGTGWGIVWAELGSVAGRGGRLSARTLRQFGVDRFPTSFAREVAVGVDRAGRLACRGIIAADPDHAS